MTNRTPLWPSQVRCIAEWLLHGEAGASSTALAAVALGAVPTPDVAAPHDEVDCRLCEVLAANCPDVVSALPYLAAANKRWKKWEKRIRRAAERGAWEP